VVAIVSKEPNREVKSDILSGALLVKIVAESDPHVPGLSIETTESTATLGEGTGVPVFTAISDLGTPANRSDSTVASGKSCFISRLESNAISSLRWSQQDWEGRAPKPQTVKFRISRRWTSLGSQ
jgi:hypothetical protein